MLNPFDTTDDAGAFVVQNDPHTFFMAIPKQIEKMGELISLLCPPEAKQSCTDRLLEDIKKPDPFCIGLDLQCPEELSKFKKQRMIPFGYGFPDKTSENTNSTMLWK